MNIEEIAKEINKISSNYQMATFQDLRVKLHPDLNKKPSKGIFAKKSIKNNECVNYLIILLIIIFLFNLLRSFQGLDVTDEGLALIQQTLTFSGHIDPIWSSVFLSNYVGGAWLSLHTPSLIWARIGGSLLASLTALFAFLTLKEFFGAKQIFFPLLSSSLLITQSSPPISSINRSTADADMEPSFLVTVSRIHLRRFSLFS